jgi:hypothetical protein
MMATINAVQAVCYNAYRPSTARGSFKRREARSVPSGRRFASAKGVRKRSPPSQPLKRNDKAAPTPERPVATCPGIAERPLFIPDAIAAVARKDYDDRPRRQAQGQARAEAEGRYKGRAEDVVRNAGIAGMLEAGMSWGKIQNATGCSRATIAKIAQRRKQAETHLAG